jgi:hypothetical protein
VYDDCAEKKCLNSELWHACAGPLVCLPTVGTRVVYFPQGHSEQVSQSPSVGASVIACLQGVGVFCLRGPCLLRSFASSCFESRLRELTLACERVREL